MNFCCLSVTGIDPKYLRYNAENEARKYWICPIIFAQVTKMNNFSYECSIGHGTPGILLSIMLAVRTGVNTLSEWRQRSRQRRHLALLDEHLLRDVGIDRMTARQEASRRGWDI